MAYYGVGGTEEQIKVKLTYPMYRPLGYDCITNGKIEYFYYFPSVFQTIDYIIFCMNLERFTIFDF